VFSAPLAVARRPRGVDRALLAQWSAIPEVMIRLTRRGPCADRGRAHRPPVFLVKPLVQTPSKQKLNSHVHLVFFALSAWMHGRVYLWVLPARGVFSLSLVAHGFWLTAWLAAGTFAGALADSAGRFTFLTAGRRIASVSPFPTSACRNGFWVGELHSQLRRVRHVAARRPPRGCSGAPLRAGPAAHVFRSLCSGCS